MNQQQNRLDHGAVPQRRYPNNNFRSHQQRRSNDVCIQFARSGKCERGPNCKFSHDGTPISRNMGAPRTTHGYGNRDSICSNFQTTGYCKFGDNCYFGHPIPRHNQRAQHPPPGGLQRYSSGPAIFPGNSNDGKRANNDEIGSLKAELDQTVVNHPPIMTSSPVPPQVGQFQQQPCTVMPLMQPGNSQMCSDYYNAFHGFGAQARPASGGVIDGSQTPMAGFYGQMGPGFAPQQQLYGNAYFSGPPNYPTPVQPQPTYVNAYPGYYSYVSAGPYNMQQTSHADAMVQPTGQNDNRPGFQSGYKSKMCWTLASNGMCMYGERCYFAHDPSELRGPSVAPSQYPNQYAPMTNLQGQYGMQPYYGEQICGGDQCEQQHVAMAYPTASSVNLAYAGYSQPAYPHHSQQYVMSNGYQKYGNSRKPQPQERKNNNIQLLPHKQPNAERTPEQ